MLRTIWFFFKLFAGLVALEPKLRKSEKIRKNEGEEAYTAYVTDVVQNWCRKRLKEAGAEIEVHGLEKIPDRNVLFVCNHLSNLDFAVLLAEIKRPFGFVAKIELKKVPMISKWMEKINCLFMDRSDMKQQLQVILEGIKMLKEGKNLLIFPEGTRSRDGKMLEFKAGSFKLAIKSKVPIVPLTIKGTADILENNGNILHPGKVQLYVHDPVYTENLEKEQLGSLHTTIEKIVADTYYGNN